MIYTTAVMLTLESPIVFYVSALYEPHRLIFSDKSDSFSLLN